MLLPLVIDHKRQLHQIWLFIDSPRHRYACRPSLQLRWKEGIGIFSFFFYPLSIFQSPLSAEGEERVPERSNGRVSLLYAMQIKD